MSVLAHPTVLLAAVLAAVVAALALSGQTITPPWDWRAESAPAKAGGERAAAPRSSSPAFQDRDCRDFATWGEAQAFFKQAGPGDPHRLDRDRDGIACERLR